MSEPQSTIARHSVGEWEYDESTGQVDTPDGTICVGITWRPNGYIIEAAPDLLAALKAVVDLLDRTPAANSLIAGATVFKARTAIAKAEGR